MSHDQLLEGYQQTEVGVIPEVWELITIGDIGSVNSGGTPSRSNPLFWNGAIPWITTTQIDFNTIDSAEQFITKEGLNNSAAKLFPPGTLLMAMYGQGKTRGKVAILGVEATTNQACAAILLDRNVHQNYIFHYLVSQYETIRNLSNTGNQENLNGFIIKSIKIPIPPLPEQRSIAQALSDVDRLIAALEKTIDKKQAIKTATMQQLLTGKKRLPGFGEGKGDRQTEIGVIPEDWEILKLRNVLKIRHGKSQHEVADPSGIYPILATGGEIGRTNTPLYSHPSVLIGRKGTIDIPKYMDTPFWTVDTLFYSEISKNTDAKFVFYKFNLIDWYSYNEASGVPSLNTATIENIEQTFPTLKEEQRAIATVLSDMDTEIAALETRLAKTQALKQGMMQALLTGRTRLV